MKNKLLFDYTISERFLDLIGIKRAEVYEFRSNMIYFKRNNTKYIVKIEDNYYDKEPDVIHLEMIEVNDKFMMSYGTTLFQVRNIRCDEDFIKFRELTELYFKPKVIVDCNEKNNYTN